MDQVPDAKRKSPLVEIAPEETVLPALIQSAHPVEFIESNKTREDVAEGGEPKKDES
jgi:hypothetical protein